MSRSVLGDQLDIHAGGADLIFPHHENEIAQSECWTGQAPFSRYWLHNGFVNVSGEKMSKSLGNFATIRDALAHFDANTLRYFLLTNHYRMPVDFTEEALDGSKNRMQRIYRTIRRACETLGLTEKVLAQVDLITTAAGTLQEQPDVPADEVFKAFVACLCDDLNTAQALALWGEALGDLNKLLDKAHEPLAQIKTVLVRVLSMGQLLGFNSQLVWQQFAGQNPEIVTQLQALMAQTIPEAPAGDDEGDLMATLLAARQSAKAEKQWALADQIRNGLTDLGYRLMDSADKTTWER